MPARLVWDIIDLQTLDEHIVWYIANRLSEKTRRNWDYAVSHWMSFNNLYGFAPTLAHEHKVCQYSVYRFKQHNVGAGHIRTEMYGVRDLFLRDLNKKLVITRAAMPRWHAVLDGRKVEAPPGTGSVFVTSMMLTELFKSELLNTGVYNNQIFRFGFALLHNTIRRSDEIIRNCLTKLECQNIVFENGLSRPFAEDKSAIFVFNFSKKNKNGDVQSAPLFHWCKHGLICALCELIQLYKWRPNIWNDTDKLLMFEDKSVLTYKTLRNKWIALCKAHNYDHSVHTLHGFRGGGNYDMKNAGVIFCDRMKMGGWSSPESMLLYDLKMQPQHLHQSIAQLCGFTDTKPFSSKFFDGLIKKRQRDIDLRNARNKKIKIVGLAQLANANCRTKTVKAKKRLHGNAKRRQKRRLFSKTKSE